MTPIIKVSIFNGSTKARIAKNVQNVSKDFFDARNF